MTFEVALCPALPSGLLPAEDDTANPPGRQGFTGVPGYICPV